MDRRMIARPAAAKGDDRAIIPKAREPLLQRLSIWTVFLAMAGCPDSLTGPNAGGESHFLSRCNDSCGEGLECIAGFCTVECEADGDSCRDLSRAAACVEKDVGGGTVSVCDVACEASADCAAVDDELTCNSGFCRGPLVDRTSAGFDSDTEASDGGALDGGISEAGSVSATEVNYIADPMIQAITEDCPKFESGDITFMGLSGIRLEVGEKRVAATAPLLFYWRNTLGGGAGEYASAAPEVAQGIVSEGGVIVSFQSTSGRGDCSCSGTNIFCLGDLDIADQIAACAVRDHNVDPHRIYTLGSGSGGGFFSVCMAAHRSSYIAAVASNSGGFPVIAQPFESDHAPALMTVHGAPETDVVGISFAESSAVADQAFKDHGGFVVNCNHGGGHAGGEVVATQVWEFFQAHPYGIDPVPWRWSLPDSFPGYCEVFGGVAYPGPCTQDMDNDADGTVNVHEAYTYDEYGNVLIKEHDYPADGVADTRTTYTYDEHGNVLSEETDGSIFDPADGTVDSRATYTYTFDADGNVLTKESSGDRIAYTYDDQGNVVLEEWGLDANGRALFRVRNTYDAQGNLLVKEEYTGEMFVGGGDDVADDRLTYAYDANGIMLYQDWDEYADGTVDRRDTYTYDKRGNRLVEEWDDDLDGTVDNLVTYTYGCWE